MSAPEIRHDPRLIRTALTVAEATNNAQAARETGVDWQTIARWRGLRSRYGTQWPTEDYIAVWDADQAAHATYRAHRARLAYTYTQRRYLNGGQRLRVPSVGTARRIQGLFALGWTLHQLADLLSISHTRVGHMMNSRYAYLDRQTADRVAELYDALSMQRPPADQDRHTRGYVRVHDRARNEARRRGYAFPLEWDDETIDNPDAIPHRPRKIDDQRDKHDVDAIVVERFLACDITPGLWATLAEKREITRRWEQDGRSLGELERLTGWNSNRYVTREDGAA